MPLKDTYLSPTRFAATDPHHPILRTLSLRSGPRAVATLTGEIDISSVEQIRATVAECLREPRPQSCVRLTWKTSRTAACPRVGIGCPG